MIDLVVRATHEQELFPPHDWEFIQWIADTHRNRNDGADTLILSDGELLQWLARWGHTNRLEFADNGQPLQFHGQIIALAPHLENGDKELSFTHRFDLPGGETHSVADAKFFNHQPPLALVGNTFFLLRNAPPSRVLKYLAQQAVRARPQIEPSPAAASAQNAIESRRGLGTALRHAQGRAAICF